MRIVCANMLDYSGHEPPAVNDLPPTSDVHRRKPAAAETSLSSAYPRLLLEVAIERGISAAQVLEGTQLGTADLDSPEARISSRQAAQMVRNALARTGNQGLGIEYGLRMQPTAHGQLGYAAMSSGSLREALELGIRFVHLRQRDVTLRLQDDGAQAVLEIVENHPLGALRQFFLECLMIGLARVAAFLVDAQELDGEIWFDWAEPPYFDAYRQRLPQVRFGMPGNQMRFSARLLERRLLMSDPVAARQAMAQCERELAFLGEPGEDIVPRVRASLSLGTQGYPDLEGVASRLCMSSRTLKRKLQQAGTQFRELLDEARYRDARQLMSNAELDLQQVALALGFTDPACFTRAFRRWSGETPSAYRRRTDSPLTAQRIAASSSSPLAASRR